MGERLSFSGRLREIAEAVKDAVRLPAEPSLEEAKAGFIHKPGCSGQTQLAVISRITTTGIQGFAPVLSVEKVLSCGECHKTAGFDPNKM